MSEQEEARILAKKVMKWTVRDSKRLYYYEPAMLITEWRPDMKIEQAMMVEEQLTPEQWSQYVLELQAIVDVRIWDTELSVIIKCLQATPAQRCTAICAAAIKAVGKEE